MIDINLIRQTPDVVRTALKNRQMDSSPVDSVLELDEKRRALLTEAEKLKAERNAVSKEISQMKDAAARAAKIEAMRVVGDKISALDKEVAEVDAQLNAVLSGIPNVPDAGTPIGKDENDNVIVKTVGEPKKFDFQPKAHW